MFYSKIRISSFYSFSKKQDVLSWVDKLLDRFVWNEIKKFPLGIILKNLEKYSLVSMQSWYNCKWHCFSSYSSNKTKKKFNSTNPRPSSSVQERVYDPLSFGYEESPRTVRPSSCSNCPRQFYVENELDRLTSPVSNTSPRWSGRSHQRAANINQQERKRNDRRWEQQFLYKTRNMLCLYL